MNMNPEICRQARLARDSRFDGEFFIAVKTTGIYCRPICPAGPPAEKNVQYYRNAAQAAEAGFRPCLRCRPESAPNSPAWRGTSVTVQRALDLIHAGALNTGTLEALATRLGVGERYLRKLFQREVGVSPLTLAQNQRLLFAKKLLQETALPMTEIAFAAGFGSVRRFNSAVRASFKLAPSDIRRKRATATSDTEIELQLHYRPPYDWLGIIDYFARHAIEHIEHVSKDSYQRTILVSGGAGKMTVSPIEGRDALHLRLQLPHYGDLMPIVANVRRMFDLDANPRIIQQELSKDPVLAYLSKKIPGVRSPIQWTVYEATVRAIVGQQVSIQAARNVCARLVSSVNADNCVTLFPQAGQLAPLSDDHFPMPGRRRDTLREYCRLCDEQNEALDIDSFAALKGIGPWTTAVVAMMGYGDPDVFPVGDLGLVKAYETLSRDLGTPGMLMEEAENWRPWRSYAAHLLWRSLSL